MVYIIAENIKNNIRQLEGIIKKLKAYSTVHSTDINIPTVQKYIKDVVSETLPEPITVENVVDEISRTYNVSAEDIFSKRKNADIAYARQVSIYVVSKVINLSSTEIGKKFGKDHTTILYTINKMKDILKNNDSERRMIEDIIKNLNSQR